MGSNLYTNNKDTSMQTGGAGPGLVYSRMCFECNQRKQVLGGKTDKRTRVWRCAGCIERKVAK